MDMMWTFGHTFHHSTAIVHKARSADWRWLQMKWTQSVTFKRETGRPRSREEQETLETCPRECQDIRPRRFRNRVFEVVFSNLISFFVFFLNIQWLCRPVSLVCVSSLVKAREWKFRIMCSRTCALRVMRSAS